MNEDYDFDGTQSRPSGGRMPVWDILSIVMLVLTVCLAVYFLYIFIDPTTPLNILPPGGSADQVPTGTATPLQMAATWTASPTLELTPSNTPRPTFTPFFTSTPFSLVPPTRTPRPTNTPRAPFSATSQQVESTIIHPDLACNWAGIGGTVVDVNGSHVVGTVVVLRGTLNGTTVEQQTVTGINKEYGQSGYEFVFGNAPVESRGTLYVQLVDLQNIPMSDKVFLNTSAECTKNLILVRFKKNR
jgi:type VI secretion system secreted protein VgrG